MTSEQWDAVVRGLTVLLLAYYALFGGAVLFLCWCIGPAAAV